METSMRDVPRAGPACPFESGVRATRSTSPTFSRCFRARRGVGRRDGRRAPSGRRRGGGQHAIRARVAGRGGSRARDLADCTVEVVANTAPADLDVPEHAGGEDDAVEDDASDASSEDELAAAMRLAAAAAVEAP